MIKALLGSTNQEDEIKTLKDRVDTLQAELDKIKNGTRKCILPCIWSHAPSQQCPVAKEETTHMDRQHA